VLSLRDGRRLRDLERFRHPLPERRLNLREHRDGALTDRRRTVCMWVVIVATLRFWPPLPMTFENQRRL